LLRGSSIVDERALLRAWLMRARVVLFVRHAVFVVEGVVDRG